MLTLFDNEKEITPRKEKETPNASNSTVCLGPMATDLLKAVRGLQFKDKDEQDQDFALDEILTEPRPRKRPKRAPEALKKELEETFLTPPTSFSPEWLNKLQQYVV